MSHHCCSKAEEMTPVVFMKNWSFSLCRYCITAATTFLSLTLVLIRCINASSHWGRTDILSLSPDKQQSSLTYSKQEKTLPEFLRACFAVGIVQ